MNDLISRQAAIDLEPPERYERQYQTMNLDDAYESGWYDAQAGISQLPPADIRPVRRGRWIKVNGKTAINCSACYHCSWSRVFEDTVKQFNFCPNCGADMRGGDAK